MSETNRDEHTSDFGNTKTKSDANKQENQRLYYSFTWNNYDLELIEIVFNILRHECDWYIIQEEKGEEKGTLHLQGTLKLKKRKRISELFHIHHKISWRATLKITSMAAYCSNKDKRYGKIWTHNFKIPETIINDFQPYGWQLDILDIISKPPHPRIINWFWEPNGGVGKSDMALWLYDFRNALVCMGRANDIFHVLSKSDRKNIIVFDITKEKMEYFNYSTIEQIKNGYVMSGKYDSCILRFNRPHIFVFANCEPDYRKMTSKDRWNVIKIEQSSLDERTQNNNEDEPDILSQLELENC